VCGGAYLDALLVAGSLDEPVDVDSGEVDLVRVQAAGLDDLLNLGNADLAGRRHGRVKVAGRISARGVC
jgi:hypothetical protein